MHATSSGAGRPLLKWAGGKRQLLPALRQHYPSTFARYLEPFVGSGAVFFDLLNQDRLQGRPARLADVNADLIGCYRTLRDHTEAVIEALEALEREHRTGGDLCYYDVRDQRFNPLRRILAAREAAGGPPLVTAYPPELAAMLIFLNRTGFNGLFRLNREGAFNVPAGRYREPRICNPAHLRAVAAAFQGSQVSVELNTFDVMLADSGAGDFVYCDPPYAPISRTANFANYTAGGFTAFDQKRLQQAIVAACRRGALVVLSNSSAPEIVAAYTSSTARKAGLRLHRVAARRAINSHPGARGPVNELIVTNVAPGRAEARSARLLSARSRQKTRTA